MIAPLRHAASVVRHPQGHAALCEGSSNVSRPLPPTIVSRDVVLNSNLLKPHSSTPDYEDAYPPVWCGFCRHAMMAFTTWQSAQGCSRRRNFVRRMKLRARGCCRGSLAEYASGERAGRGGSTSPHRGPWGRSARQGTAPGPHAGT
jgi:hypothetical protein